MSGVLFTLISSLFRLRNSFYLTWTRTLKPRWYFIICYKYSTCVNYITNNENFYLTLFINLYLASFLLWPFGICLLLYYSDLSKLVGYEKFVTWQNFWPWCQKRIVSNISEQAGGTHTCMSNTHKDAMLHWPLIYKYRETSMYSIFWWSNSKFIYKTKTQERQRHGYISKYISLYILSMSKVCFWCNG